MCHAEFDLQNACTVLCTRILMLYLSLLHRRSPVTIAASAIYFATLALDLRTSAKGVLTEHPHHTTIHEYSYSEDLFEYSWALSCVRRYRAFGRRRGLDHQADIQVYAAELEDCVPVRRFHASRAAQPAAQFLKLLYLF